MPGVATVRPHDGITLEDLTDLLERLVDLQGCPPDVQLAAAEVGQAG